MFDLPHQSKMLSPRSLSFLNLLAYTLNALETFGLGPFSSQFTQDQDNASISQKYQTIITPHGIAFSIWGVIFLAEAIFVGVTLMSKEKRENTLVVDGVSFWFVLVCIAQTAWSPAFAYEKIPLAAFLMGCILTPLAVIVVRQYQIRTEQIERNKTVVRSDYWLLQFPFDIHLGWICAAFVLNLNIVAVDLGSSAKSQVVCAAISLAALGMVALACLGLKRPHFTLPWVAVWATVSWKAHFVEVDMYWFRFKSHALMTIYDLC